MITMVPTKRKTHEIDAAGQTVGRLSSRIAQLLMGKGIRTYAPNVDGGDIVVIQNVRDLKISIKKGIQKEYKHFSGYPGGLKITSWEVMLKKDPVKLLRLAVYRMLPKNKLRPEMIKRLKIK